MDDRTRVKPTAARSVCVLNRLKRKLTVCGRIGVETERKQTGTSEGRSSETDPKEASKEYDERAAALWAVYVQEAEVRRFACGTAHALITYA